MQIIMDVNNIVIGHENEHAIKQLRTTSFYNWIELIMIIVIICYDQYNEQNNGYNSDRCSLLLRKSLSFVFDSYY